MGYNNYVGIRCRTFRIEMRATHSDSKVKVTEHKMHHCRFVSFMDPNNSGSIAILSSLNMLMKAKTRFCDANNFVVCVRGSNKI